MAQNIILDKLEGVKTRYDEVSELIADPEIVTDMKRYVKLNKEFKELQPVVEAYNEYKNVLTNIRSTKEMLEDEKDEEMREMAKMELDDLYKNIGPLEEQIKVLLLPADPEDSKNAIVEIRAGTGGDEASIFAGDLYRMYAKFCETRKWKMAVTHVSEGTVGIGCAQGSACSGYRNTRQGSHLGSKRCCFARSR